MDPRGEIVSERFRNKVLTAIPVLRTHPRVREREEWLRFFNLICFGRFVSSDARPKKVITHDGIREAIGRPASEPFSSGRFIATFTDAVLPAFTVSLYDHRTGKAREIIDDGLGPLKRDLLSELETFPTCGDAEKVYMVNGERWTPEKARALREDDRREAEKTVPTVSAAQSIVRYLNSLKSNLFTSVVHANMGAAVEVARSITETSHRKIELTKLHRISVQPQPFYGPPDEPHTVRVFAQNVSIPTLRNELKHALTRGWSTFDLKSAQFAIVAKDWGITDLHAELSSGVDIWARLTALYSIMDPAQTKPLLKRAVYSVCYGMARDNVIASLKEGFAELGCNSLDAHVNAMVFVDDAYVAPLFHHRERAMDRVKRERGAQDCFGQWIAVSKHVQPRKVLAQLSQAREMHLLLPAIDLATSERKNEFKIVLWEHDGFSVHFTRKDRVEVESERICEAVNHRCRSLGYPTRLERKGSSSPPQAHGLTHE